MISHKMNEILSSTLQRKRHSHAAADAQSGNPTCGFALKHFMQQGNAD